MTIWVENERVKSDLKSREIPFKSGVRIPLEKIDWGWSEKNEGRLGERYDPERVSEIANNAQSGIPIPQVFVFERDSGKYGIIGGVHRCKGVEEAGEKYVVAVVASIPSDAVSVFRRLAFADNRREGQRATAAEAVEHAVWEVENFSAPIDEVAKDYSVDPGKISAKIRINATRRLLAEAGVQSTKLPDTSIDKMARLGFNSSVLAAVASAAIQIKATAQDILEISRQVMKKKTEIQQLSCVDEWKQSLITVLPQVNGHVTRAAHTKLTSPFRALKTAISRFDSPEDVVMEDEIKRTLKHEWPEIRRFLNALLG